MMAELEANASKSATDADALGVAVTAPKLRVLLIIAGGIAAYKALEVIRLLAKRGVATRAVMTEAAHQFVTPLSVGALTGDTVFTDLFDLTAEAEMGHIELSRSADVLLVVPATANLISKMAHGVADDMASTVLLATDTPIVVAPAMNVRMWLHPATQRNLKTLQLDGVTVIDPDEGDMACGEYGPGRLAEPGRIVAEVMTHLSRKASVGAARSLAGKHVLVTSGPTREPIDPVRYIANHSSGKQGHAIAAEAVAAGARVTLVSGPVTISPPAGVNLITVETAQEMLDAVQSQMPADVAIFAAAVADWRVDVSAASKIKKQPGGGPPTLMLTENPDILATIGTSDACRPALVIGFAAETDDVLHNARAKLDRKGADWIVANDVSPETGVMGGDRNSVHIVSHDGIDAWPEMSKQDVARRLIARVADTLSTRPTNPDIAP